jgi:spore germination cell wall hydrolase CwlJ-like protein
MISERDVDVLARTVYGEARGEPWLGKLAVAYVVLRRATLASLGRERPLFGDGTIAGACLARVQFSCWNDGDPNREKLEAVTLDDPVFRDCALAALSAITNHEQDPTDRATHYHADGVEPSWAEGKHFLSIGRHRFYRLA